MSKTLDLDEMEKLEKLATPGPWDAEDSGYVFAQVPGGRPNGEGIAIFECYTRSKATNPKADAAFTAAARSFIPLAIERMRELERAMETHEHVLKARIAALQRQRDDLQAAEVERRRKAEAENKAMREEIFARKMTDLTEEAWNEQGLSSEERSRRVEKMLVRLNALREEKAT